MKNGADVGFFRQTKDVDPVGLMFTEKQFKALEMLCGNTDIREEFYYYWNDVMNASGYTPKLLLVFSAWKLLPRAALGKKTSKNLKRF